MSIRMKKQQQNNGSRPSHLPRLDGYISAREAAAVLGVSTRSVYTYIRAGELSAVQVGKWTALQVEAVQAFARKPVGRERKLTPMWHVPVAANMLVLTSIMVPVRAGQEGKLESKLAEMRADRKHILTGTVNRFITRLDLQNVHFVLVWRTLGMLSHEDRTAALTAMCVELNDVLAWETSCWQEGPVLLHA
jgi:excisionase family DNA binding protein